MKKLLNIIILCCCTSAFSADLKNPPDGFTWRILDEVKGAILVPAGWHVKDQKAGDQYLWAISKENVDEKGFFRTGLTYICMRNVRTKPQGRVPPSSFAAAIVAELEVKFEIERKDCGLQGPFRIFRTQYIDARPTSEDVRVYNFMLANDETGTLYQAIFEAPSDEWDEAWKQGSVILGNLRIESDI